MLIRSGTISACNPATVSGTIDNAIFVGYRSFTGTLPNITGWTGSNSGPLQFTLRGSPFPATGCAFTAASNALAYAFTGPARNVESFSFTGSADSITGGCPPSAALRSSPNLLSNRLALTLI
jgi:hypothetical protein